MLGKQRTHGPASKVAKLKRVAIFWWVLALDNALQGIGGLAKWLLEETEEGRLANSLEGPLLVISFDQGPDGWAAVNWLEQHYFNIDNIPDPSHGVYDDGRLASRGCGFGTFLMLATLLCNVPSMPWDDGRFGHMISESLAGYRTVMTPTTCAFFNFSMLYAEKKEAICIAAWAKRR